MPITRLEAIQRRWEAGAGINPRCPTAQEQDAIEAFESNACEDVEWLVRVVRAQAASLIELTNSPNAKANDMWDRARAAAELHKEIAPCQ